MTEVAEPQARSAAAGWHVATGDPSGTERYWDGTAWVGQPRPIAVPMPLPAPPVHQPAAPGPYSQVPDAGYAAPATREVEIPDGLKTLAITLSVLKALPLLATFLIMLVATSFLEEIVPELRGVAYAVMAVFTVILVVLGGLLVGQVAAARKGRPGNLVVWASILAVFDALNLASNISDGVGTQTMIVASMTAAQVFVVVWAVRTKQLPPQIVRSTYGLTPLAPARPNQTFDDLEARLDAAVEAAPSLLNEDGSFNPDGL
ncbi:MAG: DUF2510 domain-containing protein [Acidimicrobiales bacterium]